MILLIFFTVLFLQHQHRLGFSHRRQPEWTELMIVSNIEGAKIYFNGTDTGIKAPSRLWVDPRHPSVEISLQKDNYNSVSREISLANFRTCYTVLSLERVWPRLYHQ